MTGPKKIAAVIVAGVFVYLSMYTWNLRTGHLDALSSYTGLDASGFILRPGIWVSDQVTDFWERYVYLVDLKQKNENLEKLNGELQQVNMLLSAQASSASRLASLLDFNSPDGWEFRGARVIAHRMGASGVLASITVDSGATSGIAADMPVVSLDGVVGRVLESGAMTSKVLLLSDANSRIAVLGETNRSPGMLSGQGYGEPLKLRFVNLNANIEPGEILVSSGLSGIYPKGVPVARVTKVQRSDISLFLSVLAEPLVNVAKQEEVMLLKRAPLDDSMLTPDSGEAETGAASQ